MALAREPLAYRNKDRTHLRDMLEVGLIDASWGQYYPPVLAERLRALAETLRGQPRGVP